MNNIVYTWASLQPALPEIYLTAAICVLLMADVFFGDKNRGLAPTLTLVILAVGAGVTLMYANVTERTLLFSESYVADGLAVLLKLFGFMSMAVALFYSRTYLQRRGMMRGEYYVLALTALLGIFVLVSANSLLTVYLGVELLSLSLYAMVAFERENGVAAESAMKYFVLGAIASGMLLYGMSLIYGMTGTLMLDDLSAMATGEPSLGVILGLVFLVVAVAFKFGAVPFHMWVPDVYTGAPTGVTLFLSTLPKIASFALAFRLLAHGLGSVGATWQDMLAPLAVLSMVFGNVIAIAQSNLKRMLAYSSIAQMGFMLLGLTPTVVNVNTLSAANGYSSSMFYITTYVLTTLGTFGMVMLLSRQGFESEQIDDLKGLARRSPWFAGMMAILMFSLAGLPPTVGFYAKLAVLQAVVSTNVAGYIWLSIGAVVLSLIGAYYYLRVVKVMYFDEPTDTRPIVSTLDVRAVLSINATAVLVLGVLPGGLMTLCRDAIVKALTT
jgi:NADH-quinone oxidoreductase subunit N